MHYRSVNPEQRGTTTQNTQMQKSTRYSSISLVVLWHMASRQATATIAVPVSFSSFFLKELKQFGSGPGKDWRISIRQSTIGFKAFSKCNALYSKNLASYTLVWSTRYWYTHYAKYRMVQKALDTTGNMLKIKCQVTFVPPSLTFVTLNGNADTNLFLAMLTTSKSITS
jgi:hypothetical protein